VYRVVTKCLDHRGKWVKEAGPWLASSEDAEHWSGLFRSLGYLSEVEVMRGHISGMTEDDDFRNALSSMA